MYKFISNSVSGILSSLKTIKIEQVLAVVLAAFMVLATDVNLQQNSGSLGERMRNRIEQTDRNSERPKTTGEFQAEVGGKKSLDERVKNTVRDSAEAFNQFGKEYSVGAKESARNVRDKAADAGRNS